MSSILHTYTYEAARFQRGTSELEIFAERSRDIHMRDFIRDFISHPCSVKATITPLRRQIRKRIRKIPVLIYVNVERSRTDKFYDFRLVGKNQIRANERLLKSKFLATGKMFASFSLHCLRKLECIYNICVYILYIYIFFYPEADNVFIHRYKVANCWISYYATSDFINVTMKNMFQFYRNISRGIIIRYAEHYWIRQHSQTHVPTAWRDICSSLCYSTEANV